eukprot:4112496-Prymnesium_polylepis.1
MGRWAEFAGQAAPTEASASSASAAQLGWPLRESLAARKAPPPPPRAAQSRRVAASGKNTGYAGSSGPPS